jgi:hypothetical protein
MLARSVPFCITAFALERERFETYRESRAESLSVRCRLFYKIHYLGAFRSIKKAR